MSSPFLFGIYGKRVVDYENSGAVTAFDDHLRPIVVFRELLNDVFFQRLKLFLVMGSSWNYPGNNLMGGGASSGGGAFDPTAALGMMSFGGSLGGGQSGDLSSADQGNGGAGGM